MESQLQHTHGRHYADPDNLTVGPQSGHDYNEDEHHGDKKSVIKKVKEKAKKLKDTITKHGHGHGGHDHDQHHCDEEEDDDDEDEEMVEDPEVHGAPMYDSARVGLGGPDAILAQPRGNLERPSVMVEDRYTTPDVVHDVPPLVSSRPYGTNLSKPSGLGHPQPQTYGEEVNPEKRRAKIGQSTGMEDPPFVPNPTRVMTSTTHFTDPTYGTDRVSQPVDTRGSGQDVNMGGFRDSIEKLTGMEEDPHAPKDPSRAGLDPSNYESKVTDPTHTGGKAAELSLIQPSFDKMSIRSEPDSRSQGDFGCEPKTFEPKHPENLPRETLTGNPSIRSSSYAEKLSSSASAIADKAAVAKDVIASKLGYSSQSPSSESHETAKGSGTATNYAHKITDKVTETLAPVYEKVVDAGSSVMSKVQGSVSGAGTGTEQPQVHRGLETATVEEATGQPPMNRGLDTATQEKGRGADKGVSMKEYLVETFRPGDEDKALSEVITHAFRRRNYGESEKKSREDRPIGRVTESVEVRDRLGTDRQEEQQEHSSNVSADKGVTDRLKDAVGSWFGAKGNAPQGSLGTSYVMDEGLSSNPTGDRNS